MMQGRTDVKLLLMFQLLASTVTLTQFRLQLDVSQLTIPTSILFPGYIVNFIHFVYYYDTMLNGWLVR